MQIVNTAAGGGRRTRWNEDLMGAYYAYPGVVFESADSHDHPVDWPVAECRQEVGEALCDEDHIVPLAAMLDGEDAPAGEDAPQDAADADVDERAAGGAAGDATPADDAPLVERDPDQLTDVEQRIDAADYEELRAVAGQLDGVNGNQSATDLRVALHTDVDEPTVATAFAAVDGAADADSEDVEGDK